jgi:hypothetical protein
MVASFRRSFALLLLLLQGSSLPSGAFSQW